MHLLAKSPRDRPLREGRAQAEELWKAKGHRGSSSFLNLPRHQKISFYSHSIMILPAGILPQSVIIKKLAQMAAKDRMYKLQLGAE